MHGGKPSSRPFDAVVAVVQLYRRKVFGYALIRKMALMVQTRQTKLEEAPPKCTPCSQRDVSDFTFLASTDVVIKDLARARVCSFGEAFF